MKTISRLVFIIIFANVNIILSVAQTDSSLLSAIKEEVDRNLSELKIEGFPSPFFISYAVSDMHSVHIEASHGAIVRSYETHGRYGLPFVLVGSFQQNNLKYNSGIYTPSRQKISLDNESAAIGFSIWADLDREYKKAVQNYEGKKGFLSQMQLMPEELALPDYEKTEAVKLMLPPEKINADLKYWEEFASTASAVANKYPEIIKSNITIDLDNGMDYYYDTDDSQFAVPNVACRIVFYAWVIADDGEELFNHVFHSCSSTDKLPDIKTFVTECEKAIAHLLMLKKAPLVDESYFGPVLIEEEALGDLFRHNLFNNQLFAPYAFLNSGLGFKNDFEMMMGERVISDQLTIKSLSGTKVYKGQILGGYFPIDSEGVVPAEELVLIENGVLKNMLSRRTTTLKNQRSNGHNRFRLSIIPFNSDIYFNRQVCPGVIHVTGQNTYKNAEMKHKLIDAARDAGLEYAYIISSMMSSISGGYGIKIYVADGREEPVRGINIYHHDYKIFRKISSMSDEEYFNTVIYFNLSTYIIPKSMIFEEFELTKTDRSNMILSQPFVIPKPTE